MAGPVGLGLIPRTGPLRAPTTTAARARPELQPNRSWSFHTGPKPPLWGGPVLVSTTVTTVASFSGTHVYQLPTVAIGDRLVLVASCLDTLAAYTATTDLSAWTSFLASELNTFHAWRGYTLYITDAAAVTAWSGTTVTFNSTNGGKSTAVVARVANGAAGGLDVGWDFAGPSATVSDSQPNPPELVPAWGDDQNLWLTFATFGSGGDSATSQPQDYQDLAQGGAAASQTTTAVAARYKAGGGEDPGAFILSGTENWQALTFGVRPVQPTSALATINLAGTIASSGTLARQTGKALAGTTTPTGTLTTTRTKLLALAGLITGSGTLTRRTSKATAGATTPTGALTRRTLKALTGLITPTGTLTTVRTKILALAGTLSPTGALTRQARKPLAGATTPTGGITRSTRKALAGLLAPSGVLTTTKTKLLSLAGSITSAGVLTKRPQKALTGSAGAPSGTLTRSTAKGLAGLLAPTGALTTTRTKLLALAGSIASTGTLVRRTSKSVGGDLGPAGTLTRRIGKTLTGTAAPAGAIARRVGKALAAVLTLSGVISLLKTSGPTAPPLDVAHRAEVANPHTAIARNPHVAEVTNRHTAITWPMRIDENTSPHQATIRSVP